MNLLDAEDVRAVGRKSKTSFRKLVEEMREQELLLLPARHHTRLAELELDCQVYTALQYEQLRYDRQLPEGAFFCRHAVEARTLALAGTIKRAWEVEPAV